MVSRKLELSTILPLTCNRSGTCCHGNRVQLNPWEIFSLAKAKHVSSRSFRDDFTFSGGTKLRFEGKSTFNEKKSCNLYEENIGCSVHSARPLACRLFPLGRQIQFGEVHYMYQGENFPCLTNCADVLNLPQLTVGEYLEGQATEYFENAQDEYLELMQNLADIAFEMFLDTGLAKSDETNTLSVWKEMGNDEPETLSLKIDNAWIDALMIPPISFDCNDPRDFVQQHSSILQNKAQDAFKDLTTNAEFHDASVLMMALALQLARAIGADPQGLSLHWCELAEGFREQL